MKRSKLIRTSFELHYGRRHSISFNVGNLMEFAQLKPGPGFDPAQGLLYYTQRVVTAPKLRQLVVAGLRSRIHARQGALDLAQQALTPAEEASLHTLQETGYAPLQTLLTANQVADIHAFLRDKRLKGRRDGKQGFTIENVPGDARIADYCLRDVIDCPHILALANSPSLLRFANRYVGCKPTISALGLRWSFPSTAAKGTDVQAFHRDSDDWRYMKVLVYLTDVYEEAGPHVYVLGSHLTKASLRLHHYSDESVRQTYGAERIVTVTGSSGFGFAVDTSGIHKGAVPTRHPRLMLQIQYSLLPAYAYRYQPELYSGSLRLDRYVNRLILH